MTATFSERTWGFLDRIATDNTKAAFDAARDTYRDEVVAPSTAYVEQMASLLPERVHPDLRGEARVGRSLFRFNRDIRFSHDKTPYKTHLDFLFWVDDGARDGGTPREQPACIVRLTASEVLLGAGQMGLRGPSLERYRSHVDDPEGGPELANVVAALETGGACLSGPDRTMPPRGWPADHPRAELLRRDGFHLSTTAPHPDCIETDQFASWYADQLSPYRDLLAWFAA